jgi:hypothetical protein
MKKNYCKDKYTSNLEEEATDFERDALLCAWNNFLGSESGVYSAAKLKVLSIIKEISKV